MSRHYDEDYHRSIAKGGEGNPTERWQWAQKLITRYVERGNVLDIGCSSGAFLKTMQGPNWRLFGIEMEPSTAERARTATGAEVFVGDACDAPFQPGSLDVITAFDLVEHVYQPRALMAKVSEWLKPGGIFVAQVPNIDSWEARAFRSYWYGLELPRHLSHFSPRSLRRLMHQSSLEELSLVTTSNSYVEDSILYLHTRGREKLGLGVIRPSAPRKYGIVFRAVKKALRMTVLRAISETASLLGIGPSIVLVFRKPS
jgi:SAM-dependent methyltransferase